jgi:hypothetical protein
MAYGLSARKSFDGDFAIVLRDLKQRSCILRFPHLRIPKD